MVQISAYTSLKLFQKFALKMASEIRIGGNKYQLSTSSGGGQYYYIQTETPETTSVQQSNGEVRRTIPARQSVTFSMSAIHRE